MIDIHSHCKIWLFFLIKEARNKSNFCNFEKEKLAATPIDGFHLRGWARWCRRAGDISRGSPATVGRAKILFIEGLDLISGSIFFRKLLLDELRDDLGDEMPGKSKLCYAFFLDGKKGLWKLWKKGSGKYRRKWRSF